MPPAQCLSQNPIPWSTNMKIEKEMKEGDYKEARYLADEAKVDAQLALAKTLKAKTKEAETQLMQSMHSLKHEINNQGSGMQ